MDTGVQLTQRRDVGALFSARNYRTPLTIEAVVATDSNEMRLFYGKKSPDGMSHCGVMGCLILGWSDRPAELRYHDPVNGNLTATPERGGIPAHEWLTVSWTIENDQSTIFVNDEKRAIVVGDNRNLSGPVGISPAHGSVITVRSLRVTKVNNR